MAEKIGVYICHCGGNISDVVDVQRVVEAVKDLPNIAVARDYVFMCSDSGQKLIEEDVKNLKLDGVVVASCSPHLHEKTFRAAVERAGLNPYLFEQVNIREQVAWSHKHEKDAATEKAIRVVRAGVAKVSLAKELEAIRIEMKPKVLVVGAGLAGIRAAIDLSRAGVNVYLVEKEPFIGGWIAKGYNAYPEGKPGLEIIDELIEEIERGENIKLYTNAEVKSVEGSIGDFRVTINVKPRYVVGNCERFEEAMKRCPVEVDDEFNEGLVKRKAIYTIPTYPKLPAIDENCNRCGECVKICGDAIDLDQKAEEVTIDVSMIILATGFKSYAPKKGEFGYGLDGVVTLPQFERLLALSDDRMSYNGREVGDVAFIYCVGSRNEEHEYCSRFCCTATINAALSAKKKFGIRSYHIYRDIRTYGKYESYYEEAGKNRMLFFRYDKDVKVDRKGEKLIVSLHDQLINKEVEIPVDLVVLVTGMELRDSEIYGMLKVPFSRDGFLQEVHPKLKPVETAIGGVLIAGTCQAPKDVVETSASASAAAAKAETFLLKGYAELEPFVVEIDASKCDGCGLCVDECPSGAISVDDVAVVKEALCRGCGACVAVCPVEAINLRGYTNEQIRKMIDAIAEGLE